MIAAMSDSSLIADIGDALCDQHHMLATDPRANRAADIAANLEGARHVVMRLREALLMEVQHG